MYKEVIFKIEEECIQYLEKADPVLKKLIHVVGDYHLKLNLDYYESLLTKMIGQQLSIKAASTIYSRVKEKCQIISPEKVRLISDNELRNCGLSRQKISYIRDLTEKVLSKDLDLNTLHDESDKVIIKELTNVKGIGLWTAEMFLIFSLGRMDIFSHGDAGLKRAIHWLYKDDQHPIDDRIYKWSPYKTIASLYLWEIVNREFITKYNDINELYEKYSH